MRSLSSSSAADLGSGDTSQHPWPRHGGSQVYSSAPDHQFLRAPESFRRAGGGGAEIVSEKVRSRAGRLQRTHRIRATDRNPQQQGRGEAVIISVPAPVATLSVVRRNHEAGNRLGNRRSGSTPRRIPSECMRTRLRTTARSQGKAVQWLFRLGISRKPRRGT
jgi:hypothetical protein